MENEVWRDVAGYDGDYQVSNFGRVKSLKNGKEKMLKPGTIGKNYLRVVLCKNKIPKNFLVHRLVAAAFIPNTQNLPEINHKDENKANNNATNLEWCDRKYNCNFGTHNKRMAESKTNGKCSKKIDQFDLDGNFIKTWPSLSQVERDLGISTGNVCDCCKGRLKSAGNFVWKYHVSTGGSSDEDTL